MQRCLRRAASTRRAGPFSTAAPGTFATTPASAGGGACGTISQTTSRRYTNDGFPSEKRNNVSHSCKLRNKQAHELELAIKGHRARQIYLIYISTKFFPHKTSICFFPSFSFRTEHILGLVDIRKRMAKNPSELLKEQ